MARVERHPLLQPACQLAVDVAFAGLTEQPPIAPPRGLRKVLQFARPSEAAWATVRKVVDTDAEFRARVAAAADAESVGPAGWLWLTRPQGWADELAALEAASLGDQPDDAGDDATAVVGRLRRRLEGAEQAAGRHEAAAAAAAESERRVRDELAARQPLIEDLTRRNDELAATLDATEAARAAAVRNLKGVEADLQQTRRDLKAAQRGRRDADEALDVLRRSTPAPAAAAADDGAATFPSADPPVAAPGPDLDALRSAVTAAAEAAGALGSALAAAAAVLDAGAGVAETPEAAPPTSVARRGASRSPARRPAPLPGGVFEESPEAADYLLRLPRSVVLVDGYNVAKTAWTDATPQEERTRLIRLLELAHARTGAEMLVVFDGDGPAGSAIGQARSRTVRVRFSAAGTPADDVVRDLVAEFPLERPVVVVSSDREVAEGARARGANVVGSRQLLDTIR